ncbi:MAG TPA: proton-conducting transporter membrane subunit [bacterium]|nr:proton-conducting transporter membrane subunit [bacterium]
MSVHLPILLLLAPFTGAWLVFGVGFFSQRFSRWATYFFLFLPLLLAWEAFPKILARGPWHYSLGGWAPPWGIELLVTPFSLLLACFVLGIAAIAFYQLGNFGAMAKLEPSREALGGPLFLLLTGSLLALLWARDGFTLYLFLEIIFLVGAGLILCVNWQGWWEGFCFLLAGSAGASLLLAGFLFLYASTGTLHLDDLLAQLFITKNVSLALAAGLLLTAAWGFLFLFPTPLLYERFLREAPHFLSGFFSGVLARVGVYVLFLILFFVLNVPGLTTPGWLETGEHLLVFAFLAGFFLAARQKDFLLCAAYLGAAQLGFILLGFVLGNKSGLAGSLMELLSQMPATMGLFLAAGLLGPKPGDSQPLSRWAGVGRRDFPVALCLVIFSFSILGVPPTGGFFGKFYLFQGALDKKDWFFLAGLGLVLLLNLASAARLTWLLFEHPQSSQSPVLLAPKAKAPLYLLAGAVLVLGLFHESVLKDYIEPALPKAFLKTPAPNVPFLGREVE